MHLSDRFIKSLPEGVTPDQVRCLEIAALAETVVDLEPDSPVVVAGLAEAGPPLLNADNKPTIMRIVAWMAHEGVNRNRQAFIGKQLAAIAPTLFQAPNFGVMDFNHSAAKSFFNEEPKVIGVWYKAEYKFDEAANKWGLLATGMMFSWLFPDHADSLLADQERLGRMRFSMMALPKRTELAQDEHGAYEILHDPVFMAVSALDIPPADSHATGIGSESVETHENTLRQRLVAAALARPWQGQENPTAPADSKLATAGANEGADMDETKLIELAQTNATLVAQLAAATAEIETVRNDFTAKLTELTASVEALTTRVTEAEVARDSAITERDAAGAKVVELEAVVAGLTEFKNSVEAEKTATERDALLAARKAKLPESYMVAFEKKPEERRKMLEQKWASMTDDEFAVYIEDELGYVPGTKLSYFDRSRLEGELPAGNESLDKLNIGERVRALMNR